VLCTRSMCYHSYFILNRRPPRKIGIVVALFPAFYSSSMVLWEVYHCLSYLLCNALTADISIEHELDVLPKLFLIYPSATL